MYERDRNKMVSSSFLGTVVTERNKKSTVAKVSRLCLPLPFSLFVSLSRSPEKLFKSFEVKCRYYGETHCHYVFLAPPRALLKLSLALHSVSHALKYFPIGL